MRPTAMDSSHSVSTVRFPLWEERSGPELTGCLVERKLISPFGRSLPWDGLIAGFDDMGVKGNRWRLRGIPRKKGGGLLQAVKESFEQLPHGCQVIVIKQRTHPFP